MVTSLELLNGVISVERFAIVVQAHKLLMIKVKISLPIFIC
jgi:hypothetical protein